MSNIQTRQEKECIHHKPGYVLLCTLFNHKNSGNKNEEMDVHLKWGSKGKTPEKNPLDVLIQLPHWLLIGDRLTHDNEVNRYIELHKYRFRYRLHPYFMNKGCWYDWEQFGLAGFSTLSLLKP